MLVNACGPNFINAAKDRPYGTAGLPVKRLPASFASAAEVLKKLAEDGIFLPAPNKFDRDVLMNIRYLPASGGRPEGCYWSVSQGRTKALADCAAEKTWKLGGPAAGVKTAAPAGPTVKAKDPASRYVQLALDTIPRKKPGARLMLIESLVDRTGSTKCMAPEDGWSYVFVTLGSKAYSAFGGCEGKTAADYVQFDGGSAGTVENMEPISLPFKDSDFALSRVPKGCISGNSTISMKLQNFKTGSAPAAGHNLVWTIDCGSQRYLVDARTGSYIGPGKKP
jgi:hypothetical protein